jgi:hypothetical protein
MQMAAGMAMRRTRSLCIQLPTSFLTRLAACVGYGTLLACNKIA